MSTRSPAPSGFATVVGTAPETCRPARSAPAPLSAAGPAAPAPAGGPGGGPVVPEPAGGPADVEDGGGSVVQHQEVAEEHGEQQRDSEGQGRVPEPELHQDPAAVLQDEDEDQGEQQDADRHHRPNRAGPGRPDADLPGWLGLGAGRLRCRPSAGRGGAALQVGRVLAHRRRRLVRGRARTHGRSSIRSPTFLHQCHDHRSTTATIIAPPLPRSSLHHCHDHRSTTAPKPPVQRPVPRPCPTHPGPPLRCSRPRTPGRQGRPASDQARPPAAAATSSRRTDSASARPARPQVGVTTDRASTSGRKPPAVQRTRSSRRSATASASASPAPGPSPAGTSPQATPAPVSTRRRKAGSSVAASPWATASNDTSCGFRSSTSPQGGAAQQWIPVTSAPVEPTACHRSRARLGRSATRSCPRPGSSSTSSSFQAGRASRTRVTRERMRAAYPMPNGPRAAGTVNASRPPARSARASVTGPVACTFSQPAWRDRSARRKGSRVPAALGARPGRPGALSRPTQASPPSASPTPGRPSAHWRTISSSGSASGLVGQNGSSGQAPTATATHAAGSPWGSPPTPVPAPRGRNPPGTALTGAPPAPARLLPRPPAAGAPPAPARLLPRPPASRNEPEDARAAGQAGAGGDNPAGGHVDDPEVALTIEPDQVPARRPVHAPEAVGGQVDPDPPGRPDHVEPGAILDAGHQRHPTPVGRQRNQPGAHAGERVAEWADRVRGAQEPAGEQIGRAHV